MTREEARQFIGQRRVWMAGYPPERQEVTCTHVKGKITLLAKGATEENFDTVCCVYQYHGAQPGPVHFSVKKFITMERIRR